MLLDVNAESPQWACRSSSRPGLRASSLGLLPTRRQLWTGRWDGRVVWWWISSWWTFSLSSRAYWPDPGWSRETPLPNSAASWSVTWTCTAMFNPPAGRSQPRFLSLFSTFSNTGWHDGLGVGSSICVSSICWKLVTNGMCLSPCFKYVVWLFLFSCDDLICVRSSTECSTVSVQRLQEEAQWLMVVEYVRALMKKRLVCRSADERRQLAQQMIQDDQQFKEIFHGLVSKKHHNLPSTPAV